MLVMKMDLRRAEVNGCDQRKVQKSTRIVYKRMPIPRSQVGEEGGPRSRVRPLRRSCIATLSFRNK